MQDQCHDPVILNLWHPVGVLAEAPHGRPVESVLMGGRVSYVVEGEGAVRVWRGGPGEAAAAPLPALAAYGYVWTSYGTPPPALFPIPEYDEPDRRCFNAVTMGVNVSAPRAIENFLDMGHFPYVHTDILGAEPHTEVKDYDVEVSGERDEVLATRCRFFQPMAAAASHGGAEVNYVYRVPHPFCAVLYKSSAADPARFDVIGLFLQPVGEERVRAHMMLCILDDENDDKAIRAFQQTIFGQDKPILENQIPKRLPLDPRAETPIRADRSAVAYRRWLSAKGVTYGTLPAAR